MNNKTTVKRHVRQSKTGRKGIVRKHSRKSNSPNMVRSSSSNGYVVRIHREYNLSEVIGTLDDLVRDVKKKTGLNMFAILYTDGPSNSYEGIVLAKNLEQAQRMLSSDEEIIPFPRSANNSLDMLLRISGSRQ